jgi:hypothetical protein
MKTIRWRESAVVLSVGLLSLAAPRWIQAQERPDDETPLIELSSGDPDAKGSATEAETDDPSARLEAQRIQWGTVTPTFRASALKEGKKHSGRKDGEKRFGFGPRWINIGPTGADYEQNGSFTGHVEDSGRARTILPHPTNPDVVYFLSSGGGLWKTTNWNSENTRWTPLTDDLPTTGGGSVAVGRNPNTL